MIRRRLGECPDLSCGAYAAGVRRHASGFTLIEMLVLIIIMAVLSTVVVPAYSRLHDRAVFDSRIAHVTGFLMQARAQAIELGTEVEVRFDPQTESFTARADTVITGEDMPTALTNVTDAVAVSYDRDFSLPADYRIVDVQVFGPDLVSSGLTGAETTIHFREDGTCDGIRFTVVRETGHGAVITLWPATASVDVEPLNGQ